jgi:hypothetical protein
MAVWRINCKADSRSNPPQTESVRLNIERVTGYVPRHSRFADGDVVEPRRNPTNGATCPVRRGIDWKKIEGSDYTDIEDYYETYASD